MSQLHSTTTSHKKGKHLSFEERVIIQLRIKDNYSIRAIAREIGCSPSTVSNEIKRGTVLMYKNHSPHYRAKAGQATYKANRRNSCRTYDFVKKSKFIDYVSDHFFNDGWSLDACYGRAINEARFTREEYYAHPYTSCEKGSVERHNGLIRRFIPKGKRIDQFDIQAILDVETWINSLPRKILGYKTSDELFEEELDKIYQVDAA